MLILSIALLAQATTPTTTTPAAAPDKKICRRVESTGSRVQARQVCMTTKEWRAAGEQARSIKQGMQDMTAGGGRGLL